MSTVKSLEELSNLRQQALARRNAGMIRERARVIVGMGTCGIAAGARETLQAILGVIEQENLNDIHVTQTGCIGLCEQEPIVQVAVGDGPQVTYGRVTPERARQILREHVLQGEIVLDLAIPA